MTTHTISIYKCTFHYVPEQGCCHRMVRRQQALYAIKLLCSGHDEREILYLCISRLLSSGCDIAESDRNWPMCQGDLLPPPSLYTVTRSTVKMWMQVHKKWGECNVKECCSQKIYNLLQLTLKQCDYSPQLICLRYCSKTSYPPSSCNCAMLWSPLPSICRKHRWQYKKN